MNKTTILDYLDETSRRYPDKIALEGGACSQSFCEMREKARQIASSLLEKGFFRKSVAVLMDKHPDTVCAFFGALYAGCFYICIDPEMPDSRIRAIAGRGEVSAVICNEKSRARAEILYGRADILCFEEITGGVIDENALSRARRGIIDTDPAYIVFTSGSTGEPKGVCASHRSVVDYAEALCATLGFDSDTVFGNQAPLYYDAPLKELLPVICLGASLVFIPRELFMFPVRLCEFIRERGINTLCWAASAFSVVSSLGALSLVDMSHLRLICFGSEVFPIREYEKWRAACPNTRFINLYGPTEATGMSCYFICERDLSSDDQIPIGKPFPNTEILLINDDGEKCGDGEVGEIYVRGSCVALGYYSDSKATERSFVQNPLQSAYPETVYRTGDLARYNERGELLYLGRRDRQIKIMGRRIEPSEIESAACECAGVLMSTLCYDKDRGVTELFYVGEAEERVVQSHLGLRLPKFMLPRRCVRLERIPQKENGKIDRACLESLLDGGETERKYAQT